jgi:circadian clock protein KaiB
MTVRPTPKTGVAPSPDTPAPKDWPELDAAGRDQGGATYVLRLYVASLTPRSIAAIRSVKYVCERHLQGRYELEIIDIYQHPTLAKGEQIVAAPTLIKKLPLPLRRLIGDMADEERVLVGLDLRTKDDRADPRD